MIKYIMSRSLNEKGFLGISLCIITFIVGDYLLNHISTLENPPMGNTVYILIGSTLLFTSVLGAIIVSKYIYDNKKKIKKIEHKRKKHRVYFLKNQKSNTNTPT